MSADVDVVLAVDGSDLSTDERAELARQLRTELLLTEVSSVELAGAGPLPPGAKAGETIAFGALAVSLAPEVFRQLIDITTSWLRRQRSDVRVEIDGHRLEGSFTGEQRQAIVTAFLERVTAGEGR